MICGATSKAAHDYFAINEDGQGLRRGALTEAIIKTLEPMKGETREHRAERWLVVLNDPVCQKHDSKKLDDHFLWGHSFFVAPIEELEHIAALVGAKVKGV